MTSSRGREMGLDLETNMKNLNSPGRSSRLTGQTHRSNHQVPSNKKIKMNKSTRRSIAPRPRQLLLTSVIFLLMMLAQERRHPLNTASNSLVVQASTVGGRLDASQAQAPPLPPNTTAINSQQSQTANKQQVHQHQVTFATPNQAINITHVTYDPLHDTIYLGATNTIYQLNGSDLSLQHEQSTGPVYDNPSCGIIECHGFEDNMKLTQDINKLLVIDYEHKKLLSCGSTKQGACRRYQLNDISQKEDLIPMAVAANDANSTTFAFVAPARYTYDPASSSTSNAATDSQLQQQQQVLYVASTYTTVGQSREMLVPAIGTRTLDEGPNLLGLYEHSFVESRIDINTHLRDYFLVNYMYGFASSSHIYFVTVQKKATSRDFEELGYHTRLARVCITDSSYNSYTEVDLKCVPNRRKSQQQKHNYFTSSGQQQQASQSQPSDYPLLQDAILVDAGSQLLHSLAQSDQLSGSFFSPSASNHGSSPDDNKVLLGVFSSAKDHTQYAGDHSAICAFSLAQIEDKFNDNINSCYTGKMQSRNMEYIAGNVQECPKNGQGGNVVNFCHETLKINGTIPIVSEAAIQYYNSTLTAITATSHVNSQVKNIYSEHLSSGLAANELPERDSLFRAGQAAPKSSSSTGPRQHTVVFAGTSSGHIKKILLNNASNGIEFEDVQLDTQTILSDLHLHSSGNQLIAATPYKVFKVPAHNCAQYASCRECSQSRNPYCGWCLLKKSCTTKSECAGPAIDQRPNSISSQEQPAASASSSVGAATRHQLQQPKWISSEASGKCIDLQSIVPDRIPMTSTGKVDLYIDRLPRLPKEHSYRCVFNRSEQTTATATQFGLSCPLPKLMDRQRNIQIQPGRDHAIVELAVRSSETNTDFLDGKITFFDCQRHTTCKDCLTTNWGCNWCLNENVCLFNTSKCDKTTGSGEGQPLNQLLTNSGQQQAMNQRSRQQSSGPILVGSGAGNQQRGSTLISNGPSASSRTSNTINQVLQCPTFDVGHQQDILIADGSERELSIRVKNMPQFKGAMKCIVEIESYEIPLKAQVQEDRVICENSTYSYAADVGLLNAQLKVIYSESNIFIDRTNFTMYKCHLLGAYLNRPDCSLCQRIDQRFDCAFCSGSCQHRSRCLERPDEACPPPRIDFVHPLSGPTLGGTRVTIEGSNLGQSFEEIANRITIGNAPCKPIEDEYRPSNRIVCLTSPVLANIQAVAGFAPDSVPGDIVVGNRAGYAIGGSKFHFKTVHLHTHQPRYGPQSGGTRITLSGVNLNIGSSVQVFLDELPCLVEMSSLSSEQLVCRTTSSRQASRAIRHLKLIIDDAQIVRTDDVFYYTSDPIINRVSPLRAYLSGGRPINVFGANLTVIQAPRMAIYDAYTGRKVNESLCVAQDDTWMQCPAPAVNLQMIDLEYAEQQIGSLNSYDPSSQQTTTISTTSKTSQGGQRIFQHDESIRFNVGFMMDSVMQTSPGQLQTEIAYTSDPKLYPFASVQYRSMQEAELASSAITNDQHNFQIEPDTFLLQPNEPALVLYGEQLRAAVSEYEITVTVGKDLCNLTQLSQMRLVCSMPLDHMATPTDEEGHQTQRALPLVVVRIGFNLRYELGFVQYHPQLVAQIDAIISNLSAGVGSIGPVTDPKAARCLTHPIYKSYMPCENESALRRLSNAILNLLIVAGYAMLGFCLLGLIYTGLFKGLRLRDRAMRSRAYKHQLARFESLERSLKNDCRVASLALQGDLNELVRHIELSGIPLLNIKQYIMKVFFPGINNHPLLLRSASGSSSSQNAGLGASTMLMVEQHQLSSLLPQQRAPPISANDRPMEHFERLLLTKPFLLSFINTLERQPRFTIRDKVNVASLLIIVLMERLDYATDIMKSLLFQLVERSVNKLQQSSSDALLESGESHESELQDELDYEDGSVVSKTTRRLTKRASNLLTGLPISKRHYQQAPGGRLSASHLGKMVNGGASSLMETTSVAAQMLLARVGHKTSPSEQTTFYQQQRAPVENLIAGPLDGINYLTSDYMSTTAFNDNSIAFLPYKTNTTGGVRRNHGQLPQPPLAGDESYRSSSLMRRHQRRAQRGAKSNTVATNSAKLRRLRCKQQAQLMLRRTESIVEKMLTNWLALTMHDRFQGPVGQSLYLLFEALKSQLESGPIDAISGDAYYSLSEHRLLREPSIQFEMVNLYVIVDTDILHIAKQQNSLLLDNASPQQLIAENLVHSYDHQIQTNIRNRQFNTVANNRNNQQSYSLSNTITLALRVLDCDTITQVKSKILTALYRNSPYSSRVGPNDVELSLRRHQPPNGHQTLMAATTRQHQQQQVTVVLQDEDSTSIGSYNPSGPRQLNTLRHYGVTDQGIMLLKRLVRDYDQQAPDDHYSNPYAEIQYGQCKISSQQQTAAAAINVHNHQRSRNSTKAWHLTRSDMDRGAHLSDHSNDSSSSPLSHSPSMMLLGADANGQQISSRPNNISTLHQQQFYHPSSSSTSSMGNVMDTHSTSANSNSMMNNMISRQHQQQQHLMLNATSTITGNHNHQDQVQQPIYCQIGSISAQSQHAMGPGGSQYYCPVGAANQVSNQHHQVDYLMSASISSSSNRVAGPRDSMTMRSDQDNNIYLARMLTSKGTIQKYIDNFFTTILTVRSPSAGASVSQSIQLYDEVMTPVMFGDHNNTRQLTNGTHRRHNLAQSPPHNPGACPPSVKWILDLLDEAALKNGITDENVIHAWKGNAFLLRFWVNFIKNPDYFLDVEKSKTLDASLSVIAQTLMDACAPSEHRRSQSAEEGEYSKLIFSKDLPKYRDMVRQFYRDVSSMRPVSDQDMIEQMSFLSMSSTNGGGKFDINLALKELCVYAVNYGAEIMNTLNNDRASQQMDLSQELEQCFRSFNYI